MSGPIVKCDQSVCSMKTRCWRHLAPDAPVQKYTTWVINKWGRCFGFFKVSNSRQIAIEERKERERIAKNNETLVGNPLPTPNKTSI